MRQEIDPSARELPPLVNRRQDFAAITTALNALTGSCLVVTGPHGSGKTLLVQHTLDDLPSSTTVCAVSCIDYDTQYKVLTALCSALTGASYTTGHHTAHLFGALSDVVADQDPVIVLDDCDFLLLNNGNDLLYGLSRFTTQPPRLVLLSTTHPDPTPVLDERTTSSLQPSTITLKPYTEAETRQVLKLRCQDWLDQDVTEPALTQIAATTANIRMCYHWLRLAQEITDGRITAEIVRLVQPDVLHRYHTAQVTAFSRHHRLLYDAITQLTKERELIHSGTVYDEYHSVCTARGIAPLCTRRISDFLKHLELLEVIKVTYHYGGHDGKTRSIRLQQLGE